MSKIKIGRNESCPCGSGKKFKKCHYLVKDKNERKEVEGQAELNLMLLANEIAKASIKGLNKE